MAGGSARRAPRHSVLSRRLHPAGGHCRHRLPEQGARLRSAVPCHRRDAAHHRRRSQASRRRDRLLRCFAHLPLHCVVPGGGFSPDGTRWIACKPGFFLPVRVLSRLFRRLFLQHLEKAFEAGKLQFFTALQHLNERNAFRCYLAPLRKTDWVVYAKPPFAGPEQVLDYVGRYTHRVAISNNRLVDIEDGACVSAGRIIATAIGKRSMTVSADEFIRRFLLHVYPKASIASVITASSAIATAHKNLPIAATCSACQFPSHHRARLRRSTATATRYSRGIPSGNAHPVIEGR
ncbi:transposase [Sinorhizobium meliloti]|uniref:IS91 family transposase n=1 Tax=Rhizobium meliloti TaxID=382 RepID=UPI00399B6C57